MANKNFINDKKEAIKKWWDSDTTKAISTIIAVLLIPGAVLAWNYASGSNPEQSILEGESTSIENIESEESNNEENNENMTEENQGEEVVMNENSESEEALEETEESTELEIGGIEQITTLPNTTSSFE